MLHTSGQNDTDIIKIDVSLFKKHYLSFNKKLIPESLYKKKQEIYNNHNCFHMSFDKDSYTPRHNYHNNNNKSYNNSGFHQHNSSSAAAASGHASHAAASHTPPIQSKNQNRLYIITSDFTEDTKTKKQFMSHLNKLTENNKSSIYPKIKELITKISNATLLEAIFATVWDFIKKTPSDIYIALLHFFDDTMTSTYLDKYIKDKEWYPPEYAFKNNLLTADEDLYDMYCDYVKWKNYVTNTIKVICILDNVNQKLIDKLLNDLYDTFFENLYQPTTKHIVHFALEQIYTILKYHKHKGIKDKLKGIDANELESSSKFLIQDILSH